MWGGGLGGRCCVADWVECNVGRGVAVVAVRVLRPAGVRVNLKRWGAHTGIITHPHDSVDTNGAATLKTRKGTKMADKPTKTSMTEYIGVPLEELPQTNPPRSYGDIKPRYGEAEGAVLFTVPDIVLETPELMDLWKTLVVAARENPLVEVDGHTIRRVMDGAEIDRQIAKQREKYSYDRDRLYMILNGDITESVYSFMVDDYISREGIEWDQAWVDEHYTQP